MTVAPLTNIALALQKHPDLPHWIKKIVMMGGSIGRGNITPYVEANAGHDPAATKLVFESGIPIDMVGLSITLGCPIRPDVFERYIPAQRGGFREIMEALIRFRSGEAMHDAVAISTLLDDRLMTWQTGEITVELAPPERSGQTVLHPSEPADMRAPWPWIRTAMTPLSAVCCSVWRRGCGTEYGIFSAAELRSLRWLFCV